MRRNLSVADLTAFGIAAIVGAGIFSTIGTAASAGGPAVSLLFVFTALACGFSAMAYAEFASSIPISGSAYTYAYASFGELVAWIIGWDLIMEYAVGNIAVAISWSGYFTGLGIGRRTDTRPVEFSSSGNLPGVDACPEDWRPANHCRHTGAGHRAVHFLPGLSRYSRSQNYQ